MHHITQNQCTWELTDTLVCKFLELANTPEEKDLCLMVEGKYSYMGHKKP